MKAEISEIVGEYVDLLKISRFGSAQSSYRRTMYCHWLLKASLSNSTCTGEPGGGDMG